MLLLNRLLSAQVFLEEGGLVGSVSTACLKKKKNGRTLNRNTRLVSFVCVHIMPYVLVSFIDSLSSYFYIAVELKNRKVVINFSFF